MRGAIACTWYRPASPVTAEKAIETLGEFASELQRYPQVQTLDLQVNVTGNHIGGLLIAHGDESGVSALFADGDFQRRIMQLGALFENWETNLTLGGHEPIEIKEALGAYSEVYRNAGVLTGPGSR